MLIYYDDFHVPSKAKARFRFPWISILTNYYSFFIRLIGLEWDGLVGYYRYCNILLMDYRVSTGNILMIAPLSSRLMAGSGMKCLDLLRRCRS